MQGDIGVIRQQLTQRRGQFRVLFPRFERQARLREWNRDSAQARADLKEHLRLESQGGTGDLPGKVLVQQEVLPQRFDRAESMPVAQVLRPSGQRQALGGSLRLVVMGAPGQCDPHNPSGNAPARVYGCSGQTRRRAEVEPAAPDE